MLLYRLNLVKWPSDGILLLRKGSVLVNKKRTRSTIYTVKPYEIVSLKHNLRNAYLFKLHNSRLQNSGFKAIPNFIEFNYKAFCFTYIPQLYKFNMLNFKFPIKKQLVFGLGKRTI
jgi:ribosomal protein S4